MSDVLGFARGGQVEELIALVGSKSKEYVCEARDSDGGTALHVATTAKQKKVVEALLKVGIAVDAVDNAGNTALHIACEKNYSTIAAMLMKEGADKKLKNKAGQSPSDLLKAAAAAEEAAEGGKEKKAKDKEKEKEKHKDKDKDKEKDKEKEKEKHKDKEKDKEKDKDKEKEKHKDKEKDKEKAKDKEKDKEKAKDKEKDKEKAKDKEKDKEKAKDKEKDKEKKEKEKKEKNKDAAEDEGEGKKKKEKEKDKAKHTGGTVVPEHDGPIAAPLSMMLSGGIAGHRVAAQNSVKIRPPKASHHRGNSTAPSISLNIYLPNMTTKKEVSVPSDYTMREILDYFGDKMNLKLTELFHLEELKGIVMPEFREGDPYSEQKLALTATAAECRLASGSSLIVRPSFYKMMPSAGWAEDPVALQCFIWDAQRNIALGNIQISDHVCIRLVAFWVQFTYGNFNGGTHRPGFLTGMMANLFPGKTLDNNNATRIQERVFRLHAKLTGLSAQQVGEAYLMTCRQLPTYGIHSFPIRMGTNNGLVGITETSILIKDMSVTGMAPLWFDNAMQTVTNFARSGADIAFDFVENGAPGKVIFTPENPSDLPEIIDLFNAYYSLCLLGPNPEQTCKMTGYTAPTQAIPRPAMFTAPPALRVVDMLYFSRVEAFLDLYKKRCENPYVECVLYAEKCLDDNEGFTRLPRRADLDALEPIMKAIHSAYEQEVVEKRFFKENLRFEEVNLSGMNIGGNPETVTKLVSFFGQFSNVPLQIMKLNLSLCNLKQDQLQQIGAAFKICTPLWDINLSHNDIGGDAGPKAILGGISTAAGHELRVLKLADCDVSSNGCKFLCQKLFDNKALDLFDVSYNRGVDEYALSEMLESVKKAAHAPSKLNFSGLKMEGRAATNLEALLGEGGPLIRGWFLDRCKLQKKHLNMLCEKVRQQITHISIGGNDFGPKEIAPLLEATKEAPSMCELGLPDLDLTRVVAEPVADVIATCPTLTALNIQGNRLTDDGAVVIMQALIASQSMINLNIANNNLGLELCDNLGRVLESNQKLEELNLAGNPNIGDAGAHTIANLLAFDKIQIQRLKLDACNITDEGMVALLTQAGNNTRLKFLSLGGGDEQPYTMAIVPHVANLVATSDSLVTLSLVKCPEEIQDAIKGALPNTPTVCNVVFHRD